MQPNAKPPRENFETSIKQLESIIIDLERGNLPLETSLEKYELGIAQLKNCQHILNSVEKKIMLINKKDDGAVQEEPFQSNPKN